MRTANSTRIDPSYEETLRFFKTFTDYSKALTPEAFETVADDIADFRRALKSLGDPHLGYSVIHVAGSKAKGSTCAFIASVLRSAGFRTGLHATPHMHERTETASVNGVDMTREQFGRQVARLRELLADGRDPAPPGIVARLLRTMTRRPPQPVSRPFKNFLAYETGSALLHFAEEKVDFAVVETGMGGRLDHSNVFDEIPRSPSGTLISVITAMAMEHMIPLGNTIEQICAHKAGILQPHGLAILGAQKMEYYPAALATAKARLEAIGGPPLLDVNEMITLDSTSAEFGPRGGKGTYYANRQCLDQWLAAVGESTNQYISDLATKLVEGLQLSISLAGRYQAENVRTVLGCAIALAARGVPITVDQIKQGIASAYIPGRFEIISEYPLVILDSCHEPMSIESFSRAYREFYGDRPAIAIFNLLRDNNIPAFVGAMVPHLPLKHVICCKYGSRRRALPPDEMVRLVEPIVKVKATPAQTGEEAFRAAFKMREGDDAILVLVNLKLMGEMKDMLPQLLAEYTSWQGPRA